MRTGTTKTEHQGKRHCSLLCAVALAAFALFAACERPEPEQPTPIEKPIVDTNDIKETWICDNEDFCVTISFLTQQSFIYSSVNQSSTMIYQLLFGNSYIYRYEIENDTILRLTEQWHDNIHETINSPFVIHHTSSDTVELFYAGYFTEPPFILDYYKFHIIPPQTQ